MNSIECIARGIIEKDDKFLLCRGKGLRNYFFPGGHVEIGESAPEALVREIKEELGEESEIVRFLGAVENKFEKDGPVHEINFVFEVRLLGEGAQTSQEDHLEFVWLTHEELRDAIVFPASLKDAVLSGNKQIWGTEGFN